MMKSIDRNKKSQYAVIIEVDGLIWLFIHGNVGP